MNTQPTVKRVDLAPPATSKEQWEATQNFALLSLGAGLLVALSVLAVTYFASVPALSWVVPAAWVIVALGLWLAFVTVTQFLNVQFVMTQAFGAWLDWQKTQREIARQTLNIETSINVSGAGNTVAVNNAPMQQTMVQENFRIVPLHTERRLVEGIPEPAIAFFVDQYDVRGWSQRAWIDQNIVLPSMNQVVDYDVWRQLVGLIERVEGVPPIQPRQKIKPVLPLDAIKRRLLGPGGEPQVTPQTDAAD